MPTPDPNLPVNFGGEHASVRRSVGFYDFAVDGGAVGTIALRGDKVPAIAYILGYKIVVDTAVTSGGAATAALGATANGDLVAATVVSGAPWSTTGPKAEVRGQTAVGDDTALQLTVAVAALTAGKFRVIVEWVNFAA